ncbi:cobalamin-binding protein [soil metagenome]
MKHDTARPGKPLAPPRIVSLLPSATEMLCAIGGGHLLVGRSHECDFPPEVASLPVLTGARTVDSGTPASAAAIDAQVRGALAAGESLYTVDGARLRALAPDLILTQDLCAVCSIDLPAVRRIAATLPEPAQVWSSNPATFEGVLDDMLALGAAAGLEDGAAVAVSTLRERMYAAAEHVNAFEDGPNVLFLEWADPLFVGGHWVPQLVERAGGRHPLNPTRALRAAGAAAGPIGTTLRFAGKSVRVPVEVAAASRPDAIIIAPCGMSLDRAMVEARQLERQEWFRATPAYRAGRIAVVDGSAYFSRPGPRLVDAFEWLVEWIGGRADPGRPTIAWAPPRTEP